MEQATKPTLYRTKGAELRTAMLSLLVGLLLVTMKFLAYYLTQSAAIFSDAMENIVNVLASGFAVYAVVLAHRPADEEHPYGHGKVEFMSAGFEGGMILLAALLIAVRAIQSLVLRQAPQNLMLGAAVTGVSMVLCAGTGWYLQKRGAAGGSVTLEADGLHLLIDAVTGGVVLLTLLAVWWTHWGWLDPAAALGVSVWIVWQATGLLRRSAAGLMDEQDAADAELLEGILQAHVGEKGAEPRICSFHKLRHRHSGRLHWVDFHIQVPGRWDVEQGHRVATAIEMEIERKLMQSSATAHVEPCLVQNCAFCRDRELSTNGHE